jgi:hypothetical protein
MNPADNVAALCRDLDVTVQRYGEELAAAADAEVDYRRERAKRILRARIDGEKAISGAEIVADADDAISDLRQKHLISDGIAEATKARIRMLQERIGFGRSLIASERAQDQLHSQNRATP